VAPHPVFFDWYVKEKSNDVKSSMLLPLREKVGLGSLPSSHYTNSSKNLNNMLQAKEEVSMAQIQ